MLRLNEEKSRIISDKHFKSVDFKRFCNDNIIIISLGRPVPAGRCRVGTRVLYLK
jgi:hypothetical protein